MSSLLSKLLGSLASGERPGGRIADTVTAGSTTTYQWEIEQDTVIENLRVRFYKNQQLGLRLDPYLLGPDETRTDLVRYESDGKDYLDGDDDVFTYDLSVEAPEHSEIVVEARNISTDYDYDFSVDFSLEHGAKEIDD